MPSLTAIKVTIGLRPNGEADHPDWTLLPSYPTEADVKAACPFGWHYDKKSGHDHEDAGVSPAGTQLGMRLVTAAFAAEAIAMFGGPPHNVTQMTEAEVQDYWNNRHAAHLPDEDVDFEEIIALKAVWDMVNDPALGYGAAAQNKVKNRIQAALDSANDQPGFRKQPMKTWADVKTKWNITYVEPT